MDPPAPRPDATSPLGGAAPPSPGVLPPGTRVDRFEVRSVLGHGATGVVYEVRHLQLGSRHALKVLSWAHPHLQVRLLAEGRAQASLHHPNLVKVQDMLHVGDAPALLMEVVDGPSLEQRLREGPLDSAEALRWFHQILAGVGAAHARGFVHRDLKPANILLATAGGRVVPKITDFGLAKAADSDLGLTDTGMTMGTPAYMAPEQIRRASRVDQRADIFSLGCILYEMLAGKAPHGGTDPLAVLNAVAEGRVRPLRQLRPDLPVHVLRAVKEAMEVDPARRLPSCEAFEAALDDEPPSMLPSDRSVSPAAAPPPPAPAVGWVLRTVGLLLLASTVTFAAVVMTSGGPPPPVWASVYDRGEPVVAEVVLVRQVRAVSGEKPAPKPPSQAPAPVEVSGDRPAPPVAVAADPAPRDCRSGWVKLPPRVRPPKPGDWRPRRALAAHHGTPDAPGDAACTFGPDATLQVVGEVVKAGEARWVWVRMR